MVQQLTLADGLALGDLHTYLQRAGRVEDGSVRLMAGAGILAVYTAIVYPRGILDESPTVLGLRTFALVDTEDFDAVVPMRSLLDRVTRAHDAFVNDPEGRPVPMTRPAEVNTVTWAGISPPRGGWRAVGETAAPTLEAAARAGIDEVAAAIPSGTGEQLVQRVRSEVWGRGIDGLEYVPAGAAFAAFSLGFLGDDRIGVFETGPWTRLSSRRGHVLVRQRPWSLKG
ncbi:hypothetical protein [Agromyces aerolatus]|uniref:hypothetical protein n=1 Tax=Agromyces sp. LY-1074 TaxID=3074080 RepID=UPI0028659533|nr:MULTISPECIES: hypothetical protein [unclassified Agromyces]MDR5699880.1 hypothetical protein [Agromyces sp. LY-1074]MDR5706308.1 hypothetical protein [Agromyces sp. LY-1358]